MRRIDVQGRLRAVLAGALPGVEVRVRVPDPRPATLVVIRREGGAAANALVDRAGIGIQCWAATEAEAYDLAERCSRVMRRLRMADGFGPVTEESLRSDYDEVRGSPRWYGSYTVTAYAEQEE